MIPNIEPKFHRNLKFLGEGKKISKWENNEFKEFKNFFIRARAGGPVEFFQFRH